MNTPSNVMQDSPLGSREIAPVGLSVTRPMYWSVRRELWENRSIYLAPLGAAAVYLLGFLIMISLGRLLHHAILMPYEFVAGLLMVTQILVGVFYSLDALHGERRDRSILFWKSLPVSDVTTVVSKASIPIVVVPLLTFAITFVTQFIMLLLSSAVIAGKGMSVATYWTQVGFFQMSLGLLYHLVMVHGLSHAPFYGWLLLVSAWARRAAFLWAFLPLLAIGFLEKIAFNTSYFAAVLGHQLSGGSEAVTYPGTMPIDPMTHLTPGHFLISPELWIGLAVTAAFLFAAVQVRRNREPI